MHKCLCTVCMCGAERPEEAVRFLETEVAELPESARNLTMSSRMEVLLATEPSLQSESTSIIATALYTITIKSCCYLSCQKSLHICTSPPLFTPLQL